jgi:hypothetical protein
MKRINAPDSPERNTEDCESVVLTLEKDDNEKFSPSVNQK